MRSLFVFLFASTILAAVTSAPAEHYDTKYDNFDIDAVLDNNRVFNNYTKCMLFTGPCTPQGKAFRKNLAEVIATNCSKCTGPQEKIMLKVTKRIRSNGNSDWEKLLEKYDKDGKYRHSFEKYINEH